MNKTLTATAAFTYIPEIPYMVLLARILGYEFVRTSWSIIDECPEVGCPLAVTLRQENQAIYVQHEDEPLFSNPSMYRAPDAYFLLSIDVGISCQRHHNTWTYYIKDPIKLGEGVT